MLKTPEAEQLVHISSLVTAETVQLALALLEMWTAKWEEV